MVTWDSHQRKPPASVLFISHLYICIYLRSINLAAVAIITLVCWRAEKEIVWRCHKTQHPQREEVIGQQNDEFVVNVDFFQPWLFPNLNLSDDYRNNDGIGRLILTKRFLTKTKVYL